MLQHSSVSSGCAALLRWGFFFLAVARVRVVRWNRGVDGRQNFFVIEPTQRG